MDDAVRTVGLTKRFRGHLALDAVALTITPGTVFGYLGANGAGKTTTIKILAGLYRPTSGRAVVLGADVVTSRDAVQARIGYLPSDFTGYPDHTGHRFLGLLAALRGGVDQRRVARLAERLDVDLDRRLGTLSHGNRQKVGIIQAFMHQPDLLLLDEPTNGLDPLVQREFLTLLQEERAAGRMVLLSSHVLSEVAAVANAVGIIDDGRLLTTRTMDELRAEAVRRVDLRFDDQVPLGPIGRVPGVQQVDVQGLTAQVSISGSLAELVRAVAPYGVVDIRTHETDLSHVFLRYYRAGGGRDAQRVPESLVGPASQRSRLG